MNILCLCRGNVGRSQITEAVLKNALLKRGITDISVVSAGTKLSGDEQSLYELSPHTDVVIEVMKEIGLDISTAKRKQLTEEMVKNSDAVILTVDEADPVPEYVTENPKTIRWYVLDPKGKDADFTRAVRDQISALVEKFLDTTITSR